MNKARFDICILDSWLKIEALNGLSLAEGKLFYPMYKLIEPAIIQPGEQGLGNIVIPLAPSTLQYIEERRNGGDMSIRIFSRILGCEVARSQDSAMTLGFPFEAQFDNQSLGHYDYMISQSEWVKALKGLGWSELELLEIPMTKIQAIPTLTRAWQRFEDAQDCYRRGDWAEVMMNCRKAFEATIKDTTGEDDLKAGLKAFSSLISETRKAEPLNHVVKNLGDFLHLARHEQLPPIHIKPEDARLAIHLTGALLTYLGTN